MADPSDSRPPVPVRAEAIPFPARRAMQLAIWEQCIALGDSEWTTWSDSVTLAECAAKALRHAGWQVVPLDAEASTEAPPSAQPDDEFEAIADQVPGSVDADGLAYIREQYDVPAWPGRFVVVDGNPGVIIGARLDVPHLRVQLTTGAMITAHPTWRVDYEDASPSPEFTEGETP